MFSLVANADQDLLAAVCVRRRMTAAYYHQTRIRSDAINKVRDWEAGESCAGEAGMPGLIFAIPKAGYLSVKLLNNHRGDIM